MTKLHPYYLSTVIQWSAYRPEYGRIRVSLAVPVVVSARSKESDVFGCTTSRQYPLHIPSSSC